MERNALSLVSVSLGFREVVKAIAKASEAMKNGSGFRVVNKGPIPMLAAVGYCFLAQPGFAGTTVREPNRSFVAEFAGSPAFYAISSDSGKWWEMGLGRAPVEEPTPFNHGRGTDVIAVTFDSRGYVASRPVYIYTISADSDQERKLNALRRGTATTKTAESLFGRPSMKTEVHGQTVCFYEISVYNPFVEFPSRH
jgi:hypothetical protein